MTIRIKPSIGQQITINKTWFDDNPFIYQFMPNLQSGKIYLILNVVEIDDNWGITSIMDIETQEQFSIDSDIALEDYWCMLDASDSFRILEED